MSDTPRVWIGCLASYNAGRLIGEWVDATDTDVMNEAQKRVAEQAVKAAKEAKEYPVYFGEPEEFFIANYDNFPSAVVSHLGEYPNYDTVVAIATFIENKGEAAAAFYEFASNVGMDLDGLDESDFDNHYRGEWDSEEDYARHYVNEVGWSGVPADIHMPNPRSFGEEVLLRPFDELDPYLDWDSIERELFDHGDYSHVNGHVFEASV